MNSPQVLKPRATESNVRIRTLLRENVRTAKRIFGEKSPLSMGVRLERLTREFGFSVQNGDLQIINRNWYVTHIGLLALARRKKCSGIHVDAVNSLCDSGANRFVLKRRSILPKLPPVLSAMVMRIRPMCLL